MLKIMTLTWNNAEKLSKLKESLIPALEGISHHWFIKSNGCKDNTVEMASQWENTTVFPYKNNSQNFSQGMNYLFNEASTKDDDLILLLNNDVIFKDVDSIKNMIKIIEKDSDVGAVGARLLYTDTNKLQHAGVIFDKKYNAPAHFRLGQKSDSNSEKNRLFQVVTGAVFLTKAEYFGNACKTNKSGIKGMDENYHWAFDDVDLSLSIHFNMEKKIVYCGSTNVFHEESASLKKNPVNHLFMNHNLSTLRDKWGKRYILDKDLYERDLKHNLYK